MKPPRIEQTIYTRLLEGTPRRHDETVVRASFQGGELPFYPGDGAKEREYAEAMLRTAGLFVVVDEDLDVMGKPDMVFPPLPFQRVYYEVVNSSGTDHVVYTPDHQPGWDGFGFIAFAIEELIQGERWRVTFWCPITSAVRDLLSSKGMHTDRFAQAVTFEVSTKMEDPDDPKDLQLYQWPLEMPKEFASQAVLRVMQFAHYIDTFGGYTQALHIPRGHARAHLRRHKYVHQSIHFISLKQIDGLIPQNESGRHVSCRFPVRGHWVKWQNGKLAGTRSWRRAHIRGPEGAPFKGRPFYYPGADDE